MEEEEEKEDNKDDEDEDDEGWLLGFYVHQCSMGNWKFIIN